MKKQNVIIRVLVVIAILVVVNLIASRVYFRLDFTADKRYTLSDATLEVLEELDDVITVKAYFTEDLPPQLVSTKREFEDQLIEYEQRSGGNIVYEFINPNESQITENEAQQSGIRPVMLSVRESDQVKQMRAYMGAILQKGEQTEIIPLIQPGAAMEYDLTKAIKKLSVENKPGVAFIQGHGESSMRAFSQLVQQLSVLYNVQEYTITDTAEIPSDYRTIAIINPTDTIPQSHFLKLDNYLSNGGNIFVAFNTVTGDLNQAFLRSSNRIGLKRWLSGKGIEVTEQFVVDAQSRPIMVQQRQGPFVVNSQVQFPYFPQISNFAEHPITKGLEEVFLPFVSSINIQADSLVSMTPLAFTSENSGLITPPRRIDINKEWTESDFNAEPQTVAVAAEGPLAGVGSSRMLVIANGSFSVSGEGQQQQQLPEDNINLASNGIDWLSDDTGLIDLRTKGVTARPLKQLEEGTKNTIKWANVIAPIILILIYAFIRRQRYQKKKQNWLQGNY